MTTHTQAEMPLGPRTPRRPPQGLGLLALTGPAGVGKSTAAHILTRRYGYVRIRFAGPLKAMLRAYLHECGVVESTIAEMIDGNLKETPCEALGGRTPRHAMQTLGTEWGRDMICATMWTNALALKARRLMQQGQSVVIDDCRFPNEVALIRELGGKVIAMRSIQDVMIERSHVSEAHVLPYDVRVLNEKGGFDVLAGRLDGALRQLATFE